MQHQTLFVFDIETVPDTDAVPNLTGFTEPDVGLPPLSGPRSKLEFGAFELAPNVGPA